MAFSQNPYTAGNLAGKKVAPGLVVSQLLSSLTGPNSPAQDGDPVFNGNITGVCLITDDTTTDYVAVDTSGIYDLNVVASNDVGTSAVVIGDEIFISAAGVLSKKSSGTFFGYALAAANASASATVIPVLLGENMRNNKPLKGSRFTVQFNLAAADVPKTYFTAPAACQVISATERHGVVAGQAGTMTLEKLTSGTAKGSGSAMLAAAWDLTSTINTPVTKNGNTDGTQALAAGDAIATKLASGAATSLADSVVTITLEWL